MMWSHNRDRGSRGYATGTCPLCCVVHACWDTGCVRRVGPIKDSLTYHPGSQGWAPRVLPLMFCECLMLVLVKCVKFGSSFSFLKFFAVCNSYMFFHAGLVEQSTQVDPRDWAHMGHFIKRAKGYGKLSCLCVRVCVCLSVC